MNDLTKSPLLVFGLIIGITVGIFLNCPWIQWKTMIPMTCWGIIGVAMVIYDVFFKREQAKEKGE